MTGETIGRPNQRRRTRKDLLEAAARLMRQGRKPSLDEIAAEALVSRATAYRYFPGVEGLLLEAALDVAVPSPQELFRDEASDDPVVRVDRVDDMLHDMTLANEAALRMMLVQSLERSLRPGFDGGIPARQNRRIPLIEAALAPAAGQFAPADRENLVLALGLIVGLEAMVASKDVLRIDDAQARRVKRWAIRALVAAARSP